VLEELRARLFAVVSREDLVACMDNIGEWVTGKRSDFFHGIVRRYDLDAILANLALEEAEEELTQVVDSIPLDPEMLSEMA